MTHPDPTLYEDAARLGRRLREHAERLAEACYEGTPERARYLVLVEVALETADDALFDAANAAHSYLDEEAPLTDHLVRDGRWRDAVPRETDKEGT